MVTCLGLTTFSGGVIMSDFENEFTEIIKSIGEMISDLPIETQLDILTKHTETLILQQKKWNKGK